MTELGTQNRDMSVDTPEEAQVKIDKGLEASKSALEAVISVCKNQLEGLPDIKFNTSLSDTRSALIYTINEFTHHLTTIGLP